ncbi:hypothetical protein GCM10011390_10360 [Aureimonas endophytica]|uniref:Uncharacterized protein n=1 Tax=Aureimonas endophytica TaxID=2027858 RepID=A0A916ZG66_9HYPH|nr:hypothetical protein [Aureimonas endophytica]GGD93507.1 hypothetical protein GCM10011390_10360 [Aureimonas endophytica]
MRALIRLREIRQGKRSRWNVEIWRGDSLDGSRVYPDRPAARRVARAAAEDYGTVVILAGPDQAPAGVSQEGCA